MILALRTIRFWTMIGALALLAGACRDQAAKPSAGPTPAEEAQRQAQISQHLLQLESQANQLKLQINQMQQEQQQRLETLMKQGNALSAQILALQQTLQGNGKAPLPAGTARPSTEVIGASPRIAPTPGVVAEPANGGRSAGRFVVRLVAVLVVIGALWVMVRIFVGRWGDEEEEEDDLLADSDEPANETAEDNEITTEEGTIRISPAVQQAAGEAKPDEEQAEKRDGESPNP